MTADELIPLVDMGFELDEAESDRSVTDVVDDRTLQLLRRENRVALARSAARPFQSPAVEPGRSAYEVPLIFVVHAHPECVFAWARLMVDLGPTPGSLVADMAPRDVQDLPVEVETTMGLDLSFSLASEVVDIGAKPELARKRTVFFPELLASGVGFHKAYWDFYAKAGDYLHTDKELRLLVDAPAGVAVMAEVVVRAKVRFRGLPGLIPLLARTAHSTTQLRLA